VIILFYNPGVFVLIKLSEIRSIVYQTLNYLDRKFDGFPNPRSSPKPRLLGLPDKVRRKYYIKDDSLFGE